MILLAAAMAISNPSPQAIVENANSVVNQPVFPASEIALRRREADVRAEIIVLTHRLHDLLETRRFYCAMHEEIQQELESRHIQE